MSDNVASLVEHVMHDTVLLVYICNVLYPGSLLWCFHFRPLYDVSECS